jgi:hypothetical protein
MTENWEKQKAAIKATQVAFELEQHVARRIHELAAREGLTPSSEIRKLVGLSYSPPKRPRLSVSLSPEDYEVLAEKYGVEASDTLEIKRCIMQELMHQLDRE